MSTQPSIQTPTPAELTGALEQAWAQYMLEGRSASGPRSYVYASSYTPCARQMVLQMLHGHELPGFNADTIARMRRGSDRERDLLIDLRRIGRSCSLPFDVVGDQERFELKDRKGRVAIVGKVDGRIKFHGLGISAPVEIKAWAPHLIAKVRRFDDLFSSPWTRRGAFQVLSYLLGTNEPLGFLLLDRAGLPLPLPVELYAHLDLIEDFLSSAEQALDAKESGELPVFIDDPEECRRCQFYGSHCNPPISHTGAEVLTDPELEGRLARREELKNAAAEFEYLDGEIKAGLRGLEQGIIGNFWLQGKWSSSTKYEIPEELKKKYAKVDPKGRFTLKIERLT